VSHACTLPALLLLPPLLALMTCSPQHACNNVVGSRVIVRCTCGGSAVPGLEAHGCYVHLLCGGCAAARLEGSSRNGAATHALCIMYIRSINLACRPCACAVQQYCYPAALLQGRVRAALGCQMNCCASCRVGSYACSVLAAYQPLVHSTSRLLIVSVGWLVDSPASPFQPPSWVHGPVYECTVAVACGGLG
jgi:hypothetical protein